MSSNRPKRKHRRIVAREVTASAFIDGTSVSYTVNNLSIGGALVSGSPALRQNQVVEFEVKHKAAAAIVRGRVVNMHQGGMGIAFESLDPIHTSSLEKLIAAVEALAEKPPPLPHAKRGGDDLPPLAPRPDDGLFDTHDPRPSRGGGPDEREEYLRTLVKNRDEALRRGRVAMAALVVEADGLRAAAMRLKGRIESSNNQLALTEVALTSARNDLEKQREAQRAERQTANDLLEQEQRRTLEAIGTVSALEAKLRRQEVDAARFAEEAETARRLVQSSNADAGALKKAREELLVANRKAIEAQTQSKRDREARLKADAELSDTMAKLETLEGEVARLKNKLISAENALERAATRRHSSPGTAVRSKP